MRKLFTIMSVVVLLLTGFVFGRISVENERAESFDKGQRHVLYTIWDEAQEGRNFHLTAGDLTVQFYPIRNERVGVKASKIYMTRQQFAEYFEYLKEKKEEEGRRLLEKKR